MRSLATMFSLLAAVVFFAPACNGPTCTSASSEPVGPDCTVKIDVCSDDHVYEFACADGKCTCSIDGQASDTAPEATECASDSITQAQSQCGWDVQVFQET